MPNLIDKLFRKKLQERNFQPKAGDWAAMNELIDTTMGSSGSGFSLNWFAVIGITLVASIGLYFGVEQLRSDRVISKKTKSNSSIELDSKKRLKENNTHYSITNNKDLKALESEDANSNKNPLKQPISYEKNVVIKADKQSSPSTIKNTTPINTSVSHETVGSDIQLANSTMESFEEQGFNEDSNPITVVSKESKNSSPSPLLFAASDKSGTNFKESSKPKKRGNKELYDTAISTTTRPAENLYVSNNLFLSSAPISSFNTLELQTIKPLSRDNEKVIKVQNMKTKRSLPLQLSIAAFGELSYVTKNIKGDREFASLIRLRNDQEKNIFTLGGGLEFQVKYKKIGLSSGFVSSNWGENIQYEDQYSSDWEVSSINQFDTTWTQEIVFTIDSVYIDSLWYYFQDSALVTVIDTILITTVYDSTEVETSLGLNAQNGKTTVSYWEIPLYFSYQFDIGDFYLSPGLGVSIGFLKITSGYYMNENIDGLIQINSGYSVMRKTLLSGQINLGVGYRLGDKFAIEATPTYRFNLGNAFENSGIIQKYSTLSFQAKLRYYF